MDVRSIAIVILFFTESNYQCIDMDVYELVCVSVCLVDMSIYVYMFSFYRYVYMKEKQLSKRIVIVY